MSTCRVRFSGPVLKMESLCITQPHWECPLSCSSPAISLPIPVTPTTASTAKSSMPSLAGRLACPSSRPPHMRFTATSNFSANIDENTFPSGSVRCRSGSAGHSHRAQSPHRQNHRPPSPLTHPQPNRPRPVLRHFTAETTCPASIRPKRVDLHFHLRRRPRCWRQHQSRRSIGRQHPDVSLHSIVDQNLPRQKQSGVPSTNFRLSRRKLAAHLRP